REIFMQAAEIRFHLLLREMDGGSDDVAWRFAPDLHEILAKIGLHHLDPRRLERSIEPDLLGDHRLAFGNDLGVRVPANLQDDLARLRGCCGPVHMGTGSRRLALVFLEVKVKMSES